MSFPDIKRLRLERAQIKQDMKATTRYTKPAPRPKPSGDIHIPKTYQSKNDAHPVNKQIYQERLKENARQIETTLHENLKQAGIEELSDWYRQMNNDELMTFLDHGYDEVLEQRQAKGQKDMNQDPDRLITQMDDRQSKEIFGDLESGQEVKSTQDKDIHHDRDIEQSLQMDEEAGDKFFKAVDEDMADFRENAKDMGVDKKPSPTDDYE